MLENEWHRGSRRPELKEKQIIKYNKEKCNRFDRKSLNKLEKRDTSEDDKSLAHLQQVWKSTVKKFMFVCSICCEGFRMKSNLVHHKYVKHGFGIKCKICSRTFSQISACAIHLSTKHSEEGYPCCDCNFKTLKASEFKNHVQAQHGQCFRIELKNGETLKEFLSEKSENGGNKNGSFQNHRKKYSCDLCGSWFSLKSKLMKHKNEHHGTSITCEICSQVFNSMVSLRSHRFTKHTGKDKICEICGYSTKKTYDFKRHQVKHNNVYTVTCTVCSKGFYSLYEFNEHKNVHTAERPYQCEVCGIDYSRRSSLILHRNRKHPETYDSSKRCHICNKVCLTKETMDSHLKTHVEGRKKYHCDICGKGLLTRMILKIHRRRHTGEKPFDCSYCGRAFSCKKNLSVHIRLHTGDRPYSCKICWKAYTKSSALKAHEKTHLIVSRYFDELKIEIKEEPISLESSEDEISSRETLQNKSDRSQSHTPEPSATTPDKISCNFCGGLYKRSHIERHRKCHYGARKEHRCEHCELSFTMMTKLVIHKKNSHGVEMKCETCDKQFRKIYAYTSHLREHKKDKSFVCDVCGFATIGKTTLEKHKLVKHHVGEFPFSCRICKKGFLSNYALGDHMNRHTGATPHQCHRCGSAYSSSKSLERHAYKCHPELFKNKIFPCKACTKIFKSKKKMEAHHANKHPNGRRNVCEVCGKDFSFRESLIRHRRIHTGEKPKECSVCKRRFACANYLQSHMRTHTGEKPYQCRFCWKKFSQRSSMVTHERSHLKGLESSGLELVPAPAQFQAP